MLMVVEIVKYVCKDVLAVIQVIIVKYVFATMYSKQIIHVQYVKLNSKVVKFVNTIQLFNVPIA
jgi:hypothetical protein